MADNHSVQDLTPEEVSLGIADGRYLLVDVREPNEVEAEAYPDAVVVPLSAATPRLPPLAPMLALGLAAHLLFGLALALTASRMLGDRAA